MHSDDEPTYGIAFQSVVFLRRMYGMVKHRL